MKYISTSVIMELILSKYGKLSEFCKATNSEFGSVLAILSKDKKLSSDDYLIWRKALGLELDDKGCFIQ